MHNSMIIKVFYFSSFVSHGLTFTFYLSDTTEVACRRRKTNLKDVVLKGKLPTKGETNSSEELNDATTAAVSGNPLKSKSIISRTTSHQFTNMYTYLSLLILPSCALLCKETGESRN